MPVLQDSKGSNYHNDLQKIISRFFTEVEDSMTFSCINQSFVVTSFYTVTENCFLFVSCTQRYCNRLVKSSELIPVVKQKLKGLIRRIPKLRQSKAIEI